MGPQSVWNQHLTYFKDHDDHQELSAAFTTDLVKEVKTWLEMGNQVVISIDVNDDIQSCSFLVAMQQLRLIEAVTTRHSNNAPCTHN
jgi:hypothetical protein